MKLDIQKFRHNELYWLLRELIQEIERLDSEVKELKPKPRKKRTTNAA